MNIVKVDIFTTNKLFTSWKEMWEKYVEKRSRCYKK